MSDENNIINEQIYQSKNEQNNNKLKYGYQSTEPQHSTKTQSYKYVYSNSNNKNNITESPNNNNKSNIYINSSKVPKKTRTISNVNINNSSPIQLESNCETNYSLNKITNLRYVNGSNKHISKVNYIRSPDIKFKSHEKDREGISKENNNINNNGERYEECICDKNSKCKCGKRRYNYLLYEEEQENNNINKKRKIIKRKNYINNNNNYNNLKTVKQHEKTINLGNNEVIISNNNINTESKYYTNERIIKYPSPHDNNKRYIKESSYNTNLNNNDKLKNNEIDILNNKYNIYENNNNIKVNSYSRNNNINNNHNHNFKSISNCSNLYSNRSIDSYSPKKDEINKRNDSNNKYKYNLCIHNINVNKEINQQASNENIRNNKRNISNVNFSPDKYKNNYDIVENIQSPHKDSLRMQNAQNLEFIQKEKLFQILVPLPQNKIDFACNMEIISSGKKKYSNEEINEMIKRQKTQITDIRNENIYSNIKKKKLIKINKSGKNSSNWNLANKAIKDFKIKNGITNKKKEINDFNIQNFEINILDNGRKFRGEMEIENNSVEYEKQLKNPNSNLLLSPNQTISVKSDYPKRDWNKITTPENIRPLSIEGRHKGALLERNVEKMTIEAIKPKNDWNLSNNKKKEVNLYLYQKKKEQNLSKERMQPFVIIGKENNWNFTTTKENETKFTIMGLKKKTDNSENEEGVINNDDYNIIEEYQIKQPLQNFTKNPDVSEDSGSEHVDLNNIKMRNGQTNENKDIIIKDHIKSRQNEPRTIIKNNTFEQYSSNNIYRVKYNNYDNKFYATKIIDTKSPHKYLYREIINIEFNDEDQQTQQNKKDISMTFGKKENQSLIQTPKSETKYSYREEIVPYNPCHFEKENNTFNINNNINRFSSETTNHKSEYEYNNIKEEDEQNQRKKTEIQNTYKNGNQNENKNKPTYYNQSKNNQQYEEDKTIDNNINIEINEQKENISQIMKKTNIENKYNSYVNNDCPEKEQTSTKTKENINQGVVNEQLQEIPNEESVDISGNITNEFSNNIKLNKSPVNESNNFNNIDYYIQEQQKVLLENENFQSPLTQSFQSDNLENNKYNNYIQDYSPQLKYNQNDNYNNIFNKTVTTIPMSNSKYSNIIFNNNRKKKNFNVEKNTENLEIKIRNGNNLNINNSSIYHSPISKNNDKNNKVKILKK